ncbi:MAG TPA: CHAD domain-containing protein [Burkholderiales bacterium]|nr:CHAD domain-containing protein [Burkholderiales bacterium]
MRGDTREPVASIDAALAALAATPVSDEGIHDARKAIKKARAALRVMREGLGETRYRTENEALRDAGRCLAPVRDAKSLSAAFESMRDSGPSARERGRIDKALAARRSASRRELDRSAQLHECIRLLQDSRGRVARWSTGALRSVPAAKGIERIHRAGRKAFAVARRSRTPEALHEWRKQVKYLMNALDMTGEHAMPGADEMRADAGKLASLLGDDHDFAQLRRFLAGKPAGGEAANANMRRRLERQRAKLQKQAFVVGARLYGKQAVTG